MDVCRTGRSELHDIASRDIAPSDESVLKPRLTPKSGSLCRDRPLICSRRGPARMSFDAARDGWDVVCLAGHGNFYCLRMIPAMLHDRTALSCQVTKELFGATGPACSVWLALAAVQTDILGYFDCVHIRGLSWNENVVQRRSCGQ